MASVHFMDWVAHCQQQQQTSHRQTNALAYETRHKINSAYRCTNHLYYAIVLCLHKISDGTQKERVAKEKKHHNEIRFVLRYSAKLISILPFSTWHKAIIWDVTRCLGCQLNWIVHIRSNVLVWTPVNNNIIFQLSNEVNRTQAEGKAEKFSIWTKWTEHDGTDDLLLLLWIIIEQWHSIK